MSVKKEGYLKINEPKSKHQFLWKYFDLHRFIYLLTKQELFFTRLDKLDDPFEGLSTRFLRSNLEISKLENTARHYNALTNSSDEHIEKVKAVGELVKKYTTELSQTKQYVNCWFAGDRESMAMWNLYSNQDSVALKVDFDSIKENFEDSFKNFISLNKNNISVIGDEITYLKLNPFDEKLKKQNLKYSALKKDLSYAYENEYRFLIVTKESETEFETEIELRKLFFSVPVKLENLKMTIIAHPKMENWKFENLKELLKLNNLNVELTKSPIVIK